MRCSAKLDLSATYLETDLNWYALVILTKSNDRIITMNHTSRLSEAWLKAIFSLPKVYLGFEQN